MTRWWKEKEPEIGNFNQLKEIGVMTHSFLVSAFLDHLCSHLVHAKLNAEPDGIKRIISKLTSRFKPYESQGWIGVDWDSITYK